MNNRLSSIITTPTQYGYLPNHREPMTPGRPPQQLNNRLDFLKAPDPPIPSAPRKAPTPKNIQEQRSKMDPIPMNDRAQSLKASNPKPPPKKTTFVAMPTIKEWEENYRPAWLLRENKNPPEKYNDAMKIYKNYIQTGKIVFNKKKINFNKTKEISNSYMNKMGKKKM